MKTTKESLQKENTKLEQSNKYYHDKDRRIRKELENLLIPNYNRKPSYEEPISWEEIFFRMGELKADADYSTTLGNNENMRVEIAMLRSRLKEKSQEEKK